MDWESRVVKIEKGQHVTHGYRIEKFGIHAMHSHGIASANIGIALSVGVIEVQYAALADHRVVVEVLLESLPELHRPFIERVVAGQKIVRANDRGIPAGIARAYPAFLDDSHIGDAVYLRKIMGRRKSVAATTNDDDVVRRLRIGVAPGWSPAAVTG